MNEEEIIELIQRAITSRSETTNVEFKDARGGLPGDLWRTISSFSHTPGKGIIVFGIHEDRDSGKIQVVNGLDIAQLQEKIVSCCRDLMQNPGTFELKVISYEGQDLLVFIVQETPDELKPCFNKKLGLPNGACIRVGNNDIVISDEEMRSFIRNSAVFKYDKAQAVGVSLDDLNEAKIRSFLEKSAAKVGRAGADNSVSKEVLCNLGIADIFKGDVFPTIAGFLIFSDKSPQTVKSFSRYIIRCVRYQGDSVSTPIIDKLDIGGTLDQQIDDMMKFILRNISIKASIEGTRRIEKSEYPEEALRELVANAVIHRDYMITETYTQINVFSNRIEISNPGNLPPGITIENIKDSQFSRNEILAAILKDMDYLEEYGRGINIVFSRMQEWGLLEPVFKNMSNTFRVTLLGEVFKELNERQISIWNMLQDRRQITAKECRQMFVGVSKATIGSDLSRLVSMGLIVLKGSASSSYYETKF